MYTQVNETTGLKDFLEAFVEDYRAPEYHVMFNIVSSSSIPKKATNCDKNKTKGGKRIKTTLTQQEDKHLARLVELRPPIWNFKLPIAQRSPDVIQRLWNEIVVNFEGKNTLKYNSLI